MNRSKNLIIILIMIIIILTIALIGAIAYIFINLDEEKGDSVIEIIGDVMEETAENSENIARQTFNACYEVYADREVSAPEVKSLLSMIIADNANHTGRVVTLNNEGITTIEQVDSTKKYTVELSYGDDEYVNEISITENSGEGVENPEEPEIPTQGNGDIEKLLFNTTFTPYLGDITGDNLNELIQKIKESNGKNPEHLVTISSNNLPNLDGIVATDIYTITFSYDEITGYINNINIDKKV